MRALAAHALPILLIFSTSAPALVQAAPAERPVSEAKKSLEAALANLEQAVERIAKDPPADADLDAASAAVTALKAAIDAGAKHEPKDLAYAKTALAARKALREKREYVEGRRAKVHLFNSRRELDRALASLEAAAAKVRGPAPGARDFEAAASALAQVEKQLQQAQRLGTEDEMFAAYLGDVRAALVKHGKAVEARRTELAVERQRASIEERRKTLGSALPALDGNAPDDAAFERADAAASALLAQLEEGKALEAADRAYGTYAASTRQEVQQARKAIDAKWSATGLARLKSELEPARADLLAAAKPLAAQAPTAEQLAEARTAAIVVSKLLGKYRNVAERNRDFRQYSVEVKKSLVEVEANLHRRKVIPAREAWTAALKLLWGKNPTDEQLAEVSRVLEQGRKVLAEGERLEKEDRAYASFAAGARKHLQETEAKLIARRGELQVARVRATLDEAKNEVTRTLRSVERKNATDEQFAEARTALVVLDQTLETVTLRALAGHVSELRSLARSARRTIDQRAREVELERQRRQVESARNALAKSLVKISRRKVPDEHLRDVDAAIETVEKTLAAGAELTRKDREYRTYDREVKKRVAEARRTLAARRDELAIEAQKAHVQGELRSLARALSAIERQKVEPPAVTAAEGAVLVAEGAISSGAELEKRLAVYRTWARDARKTVDQAKVRIARRKLELTAQASKEQLHVLLTSAKTAVEAARQPAAVDETITTAASQLQALGAALEQGAALESQERGYGNYAARARSDLERLNGELELSRQALAFRKATLAPLAAGITAAAGAEQAQDLRKQKDAYEAAVERFKSCQTSGQELLGEHRALAGVVVFVEGQRSAPKEVLELCAARLDTTTEALKKVTGLVTFEDGPKKHFERGRGLLTQGKEKEALPQFEECISSGKILQFKNPELKDRKFSVGGTTMTLAELVGQCTGEAKRLRGN